ncbi:MAG: ankyrin repeat domain-containing protein [Desulfobacteraceae bacterium]|jgi:ankyrin repeat protein
MRKKQYQISSIHIVLAIGLLLHLTSCAKHDLIAATKDLDVMAVRKILKKEVDANEKSEALAVAVSSGNREIFTLLLNSGDLRLEKALHCAIKTNDLKMAQILLERGADPYVEQWRYLLGRGTSMKAERLDVIESLSQAGYLNMEMVKLLLDNGLKVDYRGHDEEIIYTQKTWGFELYESKKKMGCTLLGYAVDNNHYDLAGYLLTKGADPNQACIKTRYRVENAYKEPLIHQLLENGWMLFFTRNTAPYRPMEKRWVPSLHSHHLTLDDGFRYDGLTLWTYKTKTVKKKILFDEDHKKAYFEYVPDITIFQSHVTTPLIMATQRKDLQMVRLLVRHGAVVSQKDGKGLNALDYARQEQDLWELVKFLESKLM